MRFSLVLLSTSGAGSEVHCPFPSAGYITNVEIQYAVAPTSEIFFSFTEGKLDHSLLLSVGSNVLHPKLRGIQSRFISPAFQTPDGDEAPSSANYDNYILVREFYPERVKVSKDGMWYANFTTENDQLTKQFAIIQGDYIPFKGATFSDIWFTETLAESANYGDIYHFITALKDVKLKFTALATGGGVGNNEHASGFIRVYLLSDHDDVPEELSTVENYASRDKNVLVDVHFTTGDINEEFVKIPYVNETHRLAYDYYNTNGTVSELSLTVKIDGIVNQKDQPNYRRNESDWMVALEEVSE